MGREVRALYVAGGTICVAAGLLGVFVPLLPTTPFLLLAAFLYARGSTRLHRWLLENRWFGGFLRQYIERRALSRQHKVVTLLALWIALGLSAGFAVSVWWGRALLGCVGVAVTAHVTSLRTAGCDRDEACR